MARDLGLTSPAAGGDSHRRRRRWLSFAVTVAVAAVAFVLVWFQPQKLFIDERVNEPVPTAGTVNAASDDREMAEADAGGPTATDAAPPVDLASGTFVSLDHGTSGLARVIELGAGERVLRLEALDTDNGPDLFVYLSTNPTTGDEGAFDDDFVNLGRLKGNKGDQNYELDTSVDLDRYSTVVIWCDRFDSAFGAAGLS